MIRVGTWAGSSFAYTSLYSALRKTPGKTVTSPKRFSNDPGTSFYGTREFSPGAGSGLWSGRQEQNHYEILLDPTYPLRTRDFGWTGRHSIGSAAGSYDYCRIDFLERKIKGRFSRRQFGSVAWIEGCLPYVRKLQDLGSQPLQPDGEASVRRHPEIEHF